MLGYPTRDDPFILDTDASGDGLGAVLSQIQEGQERVIAYASKTMSETQRRYCTTYRELLAVVIFVKQYRNYLWGRSFTVRTDHASLRWLLNFRNPEGMVARWLATLNTYDFVVVHRKGSHHINADSLSRQIFRKCKRVACPHCDATGVPEEEGCLALVNAVNDTEDPFVGWLQLWTSSELSDMQGRDPSIQRFQELKENHPQRPEWKDVTGDSEELKVLWQIWDQLEQIDGVWFRRHQDRITKRSIRQLLATEEVKSDILQQVHIARVAGHLGFDRSYSNVRHRFFWPGMKADVFRWCQRCESCEKTKSGPRKARSALQQTPVGRPFDRTAFNIIDPLPVTER